MGILPIPRTHTVGGMGILPIPRTHAVGGMGILPIPRIPHHAPHAVGGIGILPKLFTKLVEKSWKRP